MQQNFVAFWAAMEWKEEEKDYKSFWLTECLMQCGYCQWVRHQLATKANVYGFIHSFEVDLFEILDIQVAPKTLYPSFDRSPPSSVSQRPCASVPFDLVQRNS